MVRWDVLTKLIAVGRIDWLIDEAAHDTGITDTTILA
jgi:hypothetical protein